jgi:hypothetical protein
MNIFPINTDTSLKRQKPRNPREFARQITRLANANYFANSAQKSFTD